MCNNWPEGTSGSHQTVTKVVNCIFAGALHKRQFQVLLMEVESVYKGLKMYNIV